MNHMASDNGHVVSQPGGQTSEITALGEAPPASAGAWGCGGPGAPWLAGLLHSLCLRHHRTISVCRDLCAQTHLLTGHPSLD